MTATITAPEGNPFRAGAHTYTDASTVIFNEDHGRSTIVTDIRTGATFPADGAWTRFADETPQPAHRRFTDAVLPGTHVQPLWSGSSWA